MVTAYRNSVIFVSEIFVFCFVHNLDFRKLVSLQIIDSYKYLLNYGICCLAIVIFICYKLSMDELTKYHQWWLHRAPALPYQHKQVLSVISPSLFSTGSLLQKSSES